MGSVGAADDPNSGGRQMPSHWADVRHNVPSQSSPTGTQILQAVGCAEAGRYFSAHAKSAAPAHGDYRQFKDVKFHGDEITYVSLGDGSTSEGEFWEAMNTASNQKVPMIFVVQDNHYAISVPVEVQTPGGNIFGSDQQVGNAIREGIKWGRNLLFLMGIIFVAWAVVNYGTEKPATKQLVAAIGCFAFGGIVALVFSISQGNTVNFDTGFGN